MTFEQYTNLVKYHVVLTEKIKDKESELNQLKLEQHYISKQICLSVPETEQCIKVADNLLVYVDHPDSWNDANFSLNCNIIQSTNLEDYGTI